MTSTGEFKKKTTAEQKQHEAYADKHLEDPQHIWENILWTKAECLGRFESGYI